MFWDFYAACYDTLRWLKPYQQLMAQMQRLADLQPGQHILDAGCGTGNLSAELVDGTRREQPDISRPISIDAGDASTPMLGRAIKKAHGAAELRFQHLNLATTLPYEADTYDCIVCCNVLYALPDPLATLREFRRVLKPGGRLVVATPRSAANLSSLWRAHFLSLSTAREWALTTLRVPLIAMVHVLNLVIMARKKKASYHFLDQHGLTTLFNQAGFHLTHLETGYAEQDWIAVVEPTATPVIASPVPALSGQA